LSGFLYVTGEPDRAPVRIGVPHFYLHGAGAGASGALVAHMHRVLTGKGQYVDVSCQEAMARALANAPQSYTMEHAIIQRQGAYRQTGASSFMRLTSLPLPFSRIPLNIKHLVHFSCHDVVM